MLRKPLRGGRLIRIVAPVLVVLVAAALAYATKGEDPAGQTARGPLFTTTSFSTTSATTAISATSTTASVTTRSTYMPPRVFLLPNWTGDAEAFLQNTVNTSVAAAHAQPATSDTRVPEARLLKRGTNSRASCTSPSTGSPNQVTITGDDAMSGVIWCGMPTALKFYGSEASLQAAANVSSMQATAMVLRAVGAYTLSITGTTVTPGSMSCAAGYVTWALIKDKKISDEVADELAKLDRQPASFREGLQNHQMNLCGQQP